MKSPYIVFLCILYSITAVKGQLTETMTAENSITIRSKEAKSGARATIEAVNMEKVEPPKDANFTGDSEHTIIGLDPDTWYGVQYQVKDESSTMTDFIAAKTGGNSGNDTETPAVDVFVEHLRDHVDIKLTSDVASIMNAWIILDVECSNESRNERILLDEATPSKSFSFGKGRQERRVKREAESTESSTMEPKTESTSNVPEQDDVPQDEQELMDAKMSAHECSWANYSIFLQPRNPEITTTNYKWREEAKNLRLLKDLHNDEIIRSAASTSWIQNTTEIYNNTAVVQVIGIAMLVFHGTIQAMT